MGFFQKVWDKNPKKFHEVKKSRDFPIAWKSLKRLNHYQKSFQYENVLIPKRQHQEINIKMF